MPKLILVSGAEAPCAEPKLAHSATPSGAAEEEVAFIGESYRRIDDRFFAFEEPHLERDASVAKLIGHDDERASAGNLEDGIRVPGALFRFLADQAIAAVLHDLELLLEL